MKQAVIPPNPKNSGPKRRSRLRWRKLRRSPSARPPGINLDEYGDARFTTISGLPIRRLYTPADLPEDWNYDQYLNYPGQPPYTRGIHASGYRGKMWTMRQFSGFASPEETNQRYKYLLATAVRACPSPSICPR